jgi:hypothetical protein
LRNSAIAINTPPTMNDANITDWVDKLKSLLLEKACAHFAYKKVDLETFTSFLQDAAYIPVKGDFIEDLYKVYLSKINDTAQSLDDKMKNKVAANEAKA